MSVEDTVGELSTLYFRLHGAAWQAIESGDLKGLAELLHGPGCVAPQSAERGSVKRRDAARNGEVDGPGLNLKDAIFDAVRQGYVGTKSWYAGPAHLGLEMAPEAVALEPQHARAISRITDAVCEVLNGYEVVE